MTRLTGLVPQEDLDKLAITYEDLAKVYFFLGKTSGGGDLWRAICRLLDANQSKNRSFVTRKKWREDLDDYHGLQQGWESHLLGEEPEVNENQELIDELNSVIMKAEEQIEILTTKEEK